MNWQISGKEVVAICQLRFGVCVKKLRKSVKHFNDSTRYSCRDMMSGSPG